MIPKTLRAYLRWQKQLLAGCFCYTLKGESMKTVTADLPKNIKVLQLHTFADLHIGDVNCNIDDIKARIDYVAKTPNAFCVLNGDVLNNATKTSVSDIYSETLTPMQEVLRAYEILEPIKTKILAMDTGNHEIRTYKKEGIDLSYILARELGIEDRFSMEGVLLFLTFGESCRRKAEGRKITYSMYMTHGGAGGGRKEGAKAIRLADMASIVDADIYLHSHSHLPFIMKQGFYRTNLAQRSTTFVEKLFVNSSASLSYGGYGQAQEYKPASTTCPIIYLSGSAREMKATL